MPCPYNIILGRDTAMPIGVNLSCQPAKFIGHSASPTGVKTPV
jgi:hypothetical protein